MAEETEIEELSAEEVEYFKSKGLLEDEKEEKVDEEKEEPKAEEPEKVEPKDQEPAKEPKEEEPKQEVVSFDEVEADETKINAIPKSDQWAYWKWKADKKKRQEAVALSETAISERDKIALENNLRKKKMQEAQDILTNLEKNGGEMSAEDIIKILALDAPENKNKTLTIEDLKKYDDEKRIEAQQKAEAQESQKAKLLAVQMLGVKKFGEDFDKLSSAAEAYYTSNPNSTMSKVLTQALVDLNTPEEDVVTLIETLARSSGVLETMNKAEPSSDAERAKKNSQKRTSSAAVGGGTKPASKDDLSPEEALQQWDSLTKEQRNKYLQKYG